MRRIQNARKNRSGPGAVDAKVAQVVADGPRVAILNPLRCAILFSALFTRVFAFQVRILTAVSRGVALAKTHSASKFTRGEVTVSRLCELCAGVCEGVGTGACICIGLSIDTGVRTGVGAVVGQCST